MTEATRKKVVFGVAALSVLWAVFNMPGKKQTTDDTPDPGAADQPLTGSAVTHIPEKLVDIGLYEGMKWGDDPFRMGEHKEIVVETKPALTWDLTGIVYSPKYPMAVINQVTVGVGDMVNEAKVVTIDRQQVILEYKGTPVTLTVTKG